MSRHILWYNFQLLIWHRKKFWTKDTSKSFTSNRKDESYFESLCYPNYMIFSFHISMKKLNDSYLYWWILLRFPKSSELGKRRIFTSTSTSSLLQVDKIDMQTVSLIQSLIVGIRILILNHNSKLIIHLSTIVWGHFLDTDKKHLVGIANFNFHCSFKDFNFFFSVIVIATFSALIILLYLCTRLWFRKYNKTSTKKNTSNMVKLKRFLRQ